MTSFVRTTGGNHSPALDGHGRRPLNVLIYVVDAVSRFAAENLLPRTVSYLRNDLGAAIFEHHTIVGENSLPNIVAALTGKRLQDMPWSEKGALFDFPMVWRNFSDKGYVSAYMEDWSTTFRADLRTYAKGPPPTDHFGLIFSYYLDGRRSGKCAFNQPAHELHLNLPEAMWLTYPEIPKFYLGWFNEYTHEDVTGAAFLDDPLARMLRRMHSARFLDNTVTVIMGDHGNRFMRGFRGTLEGRLDHRTPFLAVVPPQHILAHGSTSDHRRLQWHNLW